MKTSLKWLAGIIFALAALSGIITGNRMSSVIALLGSAVCIPPVLQSFQDKFRITLQSGHKWAAVIVLWILVGITYKQQGTVNSPTSQDKKAGSVSLEDAPTPTIPFAETLKKELAFFQKPFNDSTFRGSVPALQGELVLFALWAGEIKRGEADSDSLARVLASQLRKKVTAFQASEFPKLRAEYGEHLLQQLWKDDIDVKVRGSKKDILEFIGYHFATNKNKAEMQELLATHLVEFRFKQTRYRWYKDSEEYTYFDLEPLPDSELFTSNKAE